MIPPIPPSLRFPKTMTKIMSTNQWSSSAPLEKFPQFFTILFPICFWVLGGFWTLFAFLGGTPAMASGQTDRRYVHPPWCRFCGGALMSRGNCHPTLMICPPEDWLYLELLLSLRHWRTQCEHSLRRIHCIALCSKKYHSFCRKGQVRLWGGYGGTVVVELVVRSAAYLTECLQARGKRRTAQL